MKRLLAAALTLSLSACHTPADEFRSGVPTAEMVKINVPQKSGSALTDGTGQKQSELKGDPSGMYALTRGATVIINTSVVAVLALVKGITDQKPTTVVGDGSANGNSAVWGPHTDALSPNTWKFTVTRTGERAFSYVLEGKAKTAADTAYVAVLSGTHQAGSADGLGHGTFLLDWDHAKTLPEHDSNVGTAEITYARDTATQASVSAHFLQVKDGESGQLTNANYAYTTTAGSGGTFQFATLKDVDNHGALELLTIKSRWQQSGAGRADVRATGGDLAAAATASECWDANFASAFLAANWAGGVVYGTEATDCAFATADFATP